MDWQTFFVLFMLFSLLLLIRQRADPTKKNAVRNFVVFSIGLIGIYVWWNSTIQEAISAFVASIIFSGLFWILVGRYNPVSSSDDIKVLGLDD